MPGFNHVGLCSSLDPAVVEFAHFRVSVVGIVVLLVFGRLIFFFSFLFSIFCRFGSISILISSTDRKGPGADNPPAGCCPRRAATVDERLQALKLGLNGSLFAAKNKKKWNLDINSEITYYKFKNNPYSVIFSSRAIFSLIDSAMTKRSSSW